MQVKISFLEIQVIALAVLQVVSTLVLWLLSPISQTTTDTFALYLSVSLLAFALVSYIYRSSKNGKAPSQPWVSFGYFTIIVLLASNLMF